MSYIVTVLFLTPLLVVLLMVGIRNPAGAVKYECRSLGGIELSCMGLVLGIGFRVMASLATVCCIGGMVCGCICSVWKLAVIIAILQFIWHIMAPFYLSDVVEK